MKIIILLLLCSICFADFYDDAIYNNHWLWFHVYSGAILTLALNKFFKIDATRCVIYVCALAIVWEIGEYFYNLDSYRNITHFLNDSTGDILGAGVASISVRILL